MPGLLLAGVLLAPQRIAAAAPAAGGSQGEAFGPILAALAVLVLAAHLAGMAAEALRLPSALGALSGAPPAYQKE